MSAEWVECINKAFLVLGFCFGFFFWGVLWYLIFGE